MAGPIRYEIEHVSRYAYSAPAHYSVMRLCLKPRADARQRLLSFDVSTDPPAATSEETDAFGNTRHVLNLHQPHHGLAITAVSSIEVLPPDPVPEALDAGAWLRIRARRNTFSDWDYTRPSTLTGPSPALAAFVRRHGIGPLDDPLASLRRLTDMLHHSFTYSPGSTSVISTVEHILETGHGVCQDYAHVMIAIARSWGIPTRYVSGYLYVTGADGEQTQGASTHAWAECLLPGLGWIGFDPTNRTLADRRYVRVAVGRDYRDVSPTRGVFRGGGESRLTVQVRMRPPTPTLE